MKINYIPLSVKLAAGFGSIIILLLWMGILSLSELKKETRLIENILTHSYTVSNAIKDIDINILNIQLMMNTLIENDDPQSIDKIIQQTDKYDANIKKNFDLLFKHYLGPEEDVQKVFDIYVKSYAKRTEFINIIRKKDINKAKSFLNMHEKQYIQDIRKKVLVLTDFSDKEAKVFFTDAKAQENENLLFFASILLFSFLLSILIAVTTIRIILYPLYRLIKITQKIENGEITKLEDNTLFKCTQRNDEIGIFFKAFRRIMNHLLLPYNDLIKNDRPLEEKTDEVRRLLQSFDKYVIASRTDTKGRIIYASKAFQEISGYTEQELIGKPHSIVGHPDMPHKLFLELWDTIKDGKTWIGQIKNRSKNGAYFWINTHISPDIDRNGKIVGYNAINENITAIKAYEELSSTLELRVLQEMKKNQEQTAFLLQQSRLAQMGEMISMIAHQWRQPLASISAITGALSIDIMMDNYDEKYFEERLDSISEISQHLSGTIDDFRNFFKDDKKEEILSIETIIHDCMNIMEPVLASDKIDVNISIEKDITIKTYLNELKQVILSIIKNAKDALTDYEIKDPKIWLKGYQKDERAYISVEDNAGGVPSEIIEKVFDPYFSTKKEKDGTGLGLYMSKTIIEDHCKGRLTLINTEYGALFTIELPIPQYKAVS